MTGVRRTFDHVMHCVAGMYHMFEHYDNHSAVAIVGVEEEHRRLLTVDS